MILTFSIVLLFPLLSYYLCQKNKLLNTLGPVVVCYAFGIILGNTPISFDSSALKTLSEISVPFAIVLLLFSTDFVAWIKLARTTIISFGLVIISVIIFSTIGSLLLKPYHEEYWKLGGMMVGVYTGGTPNMSAIGLGLGVHEETFVLLNAADLILGAIYLFIMLSFGPKLLGKFLRPYVSRNNHPEDTKTLEKGFSRLPFSKKIGHLFLIFLLSGAVVGLALAISHFLTGSEDIIVIMLSLTSLAIGLSFNSKIREFKGSFELGDYFLLVFCVSIGAMADLNNIVNSSGSILLYCAFVMLGSILFHLLLCKIFKIDRDTAVVTSTAGIFGPAFIPPMTRALKNQEVLVSGITTGIIGYAVGNYLGFSLAYLIQHF